MGAANSNLTQSSEAGTLNWNDVKTEQPTAQNVTKTEENNITEETKVEKESVEKKDTSEKKNEKETLKDKK